MANEEHVALLKQGVDAWNAWRQSNPDVGPDLIQAYLSGADLSGADLSEAFVGTPKAPGQLPDGFPKGWVAPPPVWELYDNNGRARLRRSSPSPQ